jgi:2',3'-cyclic-nucleotide 2'-phosphodiesterase (5'-nucleotidase family)
MDPLDNPGGFLQVSGLRFQIRDGRAEDVRLLDGRRLDPQASYQVVTSDFISAGGDGYAMFKQMRDPIDTGHRFSDLLVEAFRATPALNPLSDGRIQRLP